MCVLGRWGGRQSIGSCHNLIQLSLDDKLLDSLQLSSVCEVVSTSRQLPALNCASDKSGFDQTETDRESHPSINILKCSRFYCVVD